MLIMKRVPFWSFKHIAKNAIKVLQQPLSKVLTQTQIGNREKDMMYDELETWHSHRYYVTYLWATYQW